MQLALKALTIDNDHKESVVNALDAKLAAYNDLLRDVEQNQKAFRESDQGREQLQIKLTTFAEERKKDTESKELFQKSLQENIQSL